MKLEHLDLLARKYMEAESSLEEEAELKNGLIRQDCPPELASLKLLFEFYDDQKARIAIPHFKNPSMGKSSSSRRIIPLQWISIAASIVLIAVALFFLNDNFNSSPIDTYDDPETAALKAAKAIELLSLELNFGKTMALDQMKELDSFNKYLNIF